MTTTHNYEYNKEASDNTKIVTICSHCGDVKVTLTANEIPQMDLWTKPPKYYMPKVMSISPAGLRPRRFD